MSLKEIVKSLASITQMFQQEKRSEHPKFGNPSFTDYIIIE
jgi:hypothetical protein